MQDILTFIDVLPDYIILFCPGYITIYIYFFFSGKRINDTQWLIAKAVCLSYIYINIIPKDIKIKCLTIPQIYVLLGIGVGVGIIAARIHDSSFYDSILTLIKSDRSYGHSEFDIICSKDESVWVHVHLKNSSIVYEGSITAEELEADVRRYIILSGYRKYMFSKENKKKYLEDNSEDNEKSVIIYYDEIQLVEKK